MGLVPFYTLFAPVIGKELAELLAEGLSYSFPVSLQRAGRLFDALFLYRPETAPEGRPAAWMLLDSSTGRLALLSECEVMDFAAEGLSAPDNVFNERVQDLAPKKEAQLRQKLGDLYDEIRGFAFAEKLDRAQAHVIASYKELFAKLVAPAHYPYYYALSPSFFHWLRMPLPMHRPSFSASGQAVLEDSTQLLILENLQQLVQRFEQKIQVDGHKQQLFDEMHNELTEYKNGLFDQLTLALERDIIKVIDDVEKSVALFRELPAGPESYERLYALFAGVATDLEDLLYRHGVEPYSVSGERADVMRQKILATTPTANHSLDKKIAARLARGWEKHDKIIRPERVSVYMYQGGMQDEQGSGH